MDRDGGEFGKYCVDVVNMEQVNRPVSRKVVFAESGDNIFSFTFVADMAKEVVSSI